MKKKSHWLGWLLLTSVIVGCSASDIPTAQSELPRVPITGINVENYLAPTSHGLSNGKKLVAIGGSRESFLSAFPRPSRGFPLDESVPGLPKEYRSEGWETEKEGAGIITNDGQVLIAMHQYEAVDAEEFAEVLKVAQSGFSDVQFKLQEGPQYDYWYAVEGTEVCVISRLRGNKKTYQVSVTVGDKALMKFMGVAKDFMFEDKSLVAK